MNWPITVWPGAVCNDWFGVFAFYFCCLMLGISIGLVVGLIVWLMRNWRDL